MSPSYGGSSGRASVPGPNQPKSDRISGRARIPDAYDRARPLAGDGRGLDGSGGGRGPGGPGGRGPGGPVYPGGRRGRTRPRWGRIALVAGVVVLVLGLLGAA